MFKFMDWLKQKCIDLGRVIAMFLMLSPALVIMYNDKFIRKQDYWLCLVCSILYDMYMYTVISKDDWGGKN